MKSVFLLAVLNLSFFACAMGGKPVIRKDQDLGWRPCQDFEIKNGPATGKLCVRYKRENKKKAEFETRVKDFCKQDDFEFFRSLGAVFIDEDSL